MGFFNILNAYFYGDAFNSKVYSKLLSLTNMTSGQITDLFGNGLETVVEQ